MKLLMYPHGGSGNHGCEAIVRSTVRLTGADAVIFSDCPDEDQRYGVDAVCAVRRSRLPIRRMSMMYISAFLRYHSGNRDAFDIAAFRPIFQEAKHTDYALSIGGDNYCYGTPGFICLINRQLRRQRVKTVLWGCSVEPASVPAMLDDLNGYTHIYARESITAEALRGASLRMVSLLPDPAFLLERVDCPLPEGFVAGHTVGINLSPMVMGYEKAEGMTWQNYVSLIQYILASTDMQVALIPHVVWSHNDDRRPLRMLFERFKNSGRVVFVDDCPAAALKGYIARCRFVVAARTHASIAAYSEQVPTLVVGYSVKARGIARDIFGREDDYVVPVQGLRKADDLCEAFQWLVRHETDIRAHYHTFMPDYIGRVQEAENILK